MYEPNSAAPNAANGNNGVGFVDGGFVSGCPPHPAPFHLYPNPSGPSHNRNMNKRSNPPVVMMMAPAQQQQQQQQRQPHYYDSNAPANHYSQQLVPQQPQFGHYVHPLPSQQGCAQQSAFNISTPPFSSQGSYQIHRQQQQLPPQPMSQQRNAAATGRGQGNYQRFNNNNNTNNSGGNIGEGAVNVDAAAAAADGAMGNGAPHSKKRHQRPPQAGGGGVNQKNATPHDATAERFKTGLCQTFSLKGKCKYSYHCAFAHGPAELRTLEMNLRDGLVSEAAIVKYRKEQRYFSKKAVEMGIHFIPFTNMPIDPALKVSTISTTTATTATGGDDKKQKVEEEKGMGGGGGSVSEKAKPSKAQAATSRNAAATTNTTHTNAAAKKSTTPSSNDALGENFTIPIGLTFDTTKGASGMLGSTPNANAPMSIMTVGEEHRPRGGSSSGTHCHTNTNNNTNGTWSASQFICSSASASGGAFGGGIGDLSIRPTMSGMGSQTQSMNTSHANVPCEGEGEAAGSGGARRGGGPIFSSVGSRSALNTPQLGRSPAFASSPVPSVSAVGGEPSTFFAATLLQELERRSTPCSATPHDASRSPPKPTTADHRVSGKKSPSRSPPPLSAHQRQHHNHNNSHNHLDIEMALVPSPAASDSSSSALGIGIQRPNSGETKRECHPAGPLHHPPPPTATSAALNFAVLNNNTSSSASSGSCFPAPPPQNHSSDEDMHDGQPQVSAGSGAAVVVVDVMMGGSDRDETPTFYHPSSTSTAAGGGDSSSAGQQYCDSGTHFVRYEGLPLPSLDEGGDAFEVSDVTSSPSKEERSSAPPRFAPHCGAAPSHHHLPCMPRSDSPRLAPSTMGPDDEAYFNKAQFAAGGGGGVVKPALGVVSECFGVAGDTDGSVHANGAIVKGINTHDGDDGDRGGLIVPVLQRRESIGSLSLFRSFGRPPVPEGVAAGSRRESTSSHPMTPTQGGSRVVRQHQPYAPVYGNSRSVTPTNTSQDHTAHRQPSAHNGAAADDAHNFSLSSPPPMPMGSGSRGVSGNGSGGGQLPDPMWASRWMNNSNNNTFSNGCNSPAPQQQLQLHGNASASSNPHLHRTVSSSGFYRHNPYGGSVSPSRGSSSPSPVNK